MHRAHKVANYFVLDHWFIWLPPWKSKHLPGTSKATDVDLQILSMWDVCFFPERIWVTAIELLPSGHQTGIAGKSWMKFPALNLHFTGGISQLATFDEPEALWEPLTWSLLQSPGWWNRGHSAILCAFGGSKPSFFAEFFVSNLFVHPKIKGNHCPIQICNFGLSLLWDKPTVVDELTSQPPDWSWPHPGD